MVLTPFAADQHSAYVRAAGETPKTFSAWVTFRDLPPGIGSVSKAAAQRQEP